MSEFKDQPDSSIDPIPLSGIRPALAETRGTVTTWQSAQALGTGTFTLDVKLKPAGTLEWRGCIAPAKDGLWRMEIELENTGGQPVSLADLDYLGGAVLARDAALTHVFSQSFTMTGFVGIGEKGGRTVSHACLGLTNAEGTLAAVIGFERPDDAFYDIVCEADGRLHALCHREGTSLAASEVLRPSPLLILTGPSLSDLMDRYARMSASGLKARPVARQKKEGWCSWYHYYGFEDEADIMGNAEMLAKAFPDHRGFVIQIDDGWNLPEKGAPRNWGDWLPGKKFPGGMSQIVERLHGLGFEAGLWLAPFSVDPASDLAKEHPEWLVHAPHNGQLATSSGGVYGLDLTQAAVLDFLEATMRRVFDDWGFDYVKLDFLIHGVMPGLRQDRTQTTAAAFRHAFQRIRQVAGKRFILNCGSPLAPAVGLCDGMRIGFDVGGRWFAPFNLKEWPHGNCSIKAAAYPALFRQWMHRHWWENDPDCLIVRDRPVTYEVEKFSEVPGYGPSRPGDFGLSGDEAAFWARLVWMTGGMALLSEVWNELAPDRAELARRVLAPSPGEVRWVDDYRHPEVCLLQAHDGSGAVGIFNLSDAPVKIVLPREKLVARATRLHEWITGERLELNAGDSVVFPELAGRSARVWVPSPA